MRKPYDAGAAKTYRVEHRVAVYARAKRWRDNQRKSIIDFLGGKCARCGFDDIRALQIDHCNGGGRKEIDYFTGESSYYAYYKKIRENPIGYQVLCANCNWIKKAECNENPNVGSL